MSLVYLLLWQTFVLKLELILVGIQIGFVGLQAVLGAVAIASFARLLHCNLRKLDLDPQ